jgi:hypothetical protein
MTIDAPRTTSPSSPGSTRGGGIGSALLKLLLVAILLVAGWTWFTLTWSYSEGDRGGVLQKFSRKGWVCKTYEGELAMYVVAGVAPQIWSFSARDPKVAEELARNVGERVQLHYTEHVGIPTNCFGETRYFVDRIVPVPANGLTPSAPQVPATAAPAAAGSSSPEAGAATPASTPAP